MHKHPAASRISRERRGIHHQRVKLHLVHPPLHSISYIDSSAFADRNSGRRGRANPPAPLGYDAPPAGLRWGAIPYRAKSFRTRGTVASAHAIPLQYGLHEMSIAASVLDAVRAETARQGGGRVTRAGLRIGELSGVATESLRFCLEVLVADSDLAALAFEIEFVPWTRRCRACAAVFPVADAQPACTACGSGDTEAAGGDQMELSFLELEEP